MKIIQIYAVHYRKISENKFRGLYSFNGDQEWRAVKNKDGKIVEFASSSEAQIAAETEIRPSLYLRGALQ